MFFLLRKFFLVVLIAVSGWSGAGLAASDDAAAAAAAMQAIDPRPEAHMTIAELEQRMGAGDLSAQAELAARYGMGSGVKQDIPKAIELLTPAAAKGNADAQFFLASAYATGQGVPQNELQAFMLYEQAANQGHPGGHYMMASMIITGRAGISPSWLGGIPHLWAAAVKNYPPAMTLLAAAYEDGKAGVINPRAAAYWYRRSLSLVQDPRAIFNLRRMISFHVVPYEEGDPGEPPPAGDPDKQAAELIARSKGAVNP